jgi:outer membrane lipoprotein-sorting protein
MDNKKIPTWLGAVIIIIFAATAGAFVWKYEKNQEIAKQLEETSDIKLIKMHTPQVNQKNDSQTSEYVNKTFDFKFAYPNKLVITSRSNDTSIILSDKPEGHWIYNINTQANSQKLSLEDAFNQILAEKTKSVSDKKLINIASITVDGKLAKKYSIKNYTDYGNMGIVLISGENIISIFGDDSISPINSDLENILNSFKFMH